ncbi:FecR family protein [Chitinophaga varians]|uniref:FecR family protein n=1 Tax=Chitinophaga varians TaxID=2202339 RepID=UPI00165F6BBC|nr:FecR domain-containing protein [Chitinophaga varians]MBC9909328.1 FecR family protein [Chitinophaga varians]
MEFSEEEIYELIAKFLTGESSPEEAMRLEDWKAASNKHYEFYIHSVQLWEQIVGSVHLPKPTDEAWRKLRKKNQESNKKIVVIKITVAAAVTVLFFIGMLLLKSSDRQQSQYAINLEAQNSYLRKTLPDSSRVVLDKHSRLTYDADGDSRKVILKGQSWFDVQTMNGKPFEIETEYMKIKVLGTTFHVAVEKDGQSVAVTSGKVLLITHHDTLLVSANQKGYYLFSSGKLALHQKININEMAYATHAFNFEDATLENISTELSKTYNKKFVIADKSLSSRRMTAEFRDESLEDIKTIIANTLHVYFKQTNDTIIIYGKNSD